MTRIFCADITCKNCKNGMCNRKSIHLSQNSVVTVNDGRQMLNRCKEREDSKEFAEIKLKLYELLVKENTADEHGKRDN